MIVSASYKTDLPAFYGRWFMNRLDAGFCRMVNPYGGQVHRVDLDRAGVDGFVFWTRNLGPFLDNLEDIDCRGFPFIVHYTVTGYPRALDAGTIAPAAAVGHLRAVSSRFGGRAAVWRYDPIVFSSLTPPEWHRATFAGLCAALAGTVDEVVVSVAHVYRKTARNMATSARARDFSWWDPPVDEKRALLGDLAAIAAGHGLRASLCAQPELRVPGLDAAACIDVRRLSEVAGREIMAPRKPHRPDCGCWAARDIGDYDTCPHGCAYCYAVRGRGLAKVRFRAHDPDGEFLWPPVPHSPRP